MKKRCFAALLALVMASLGAQEVTDTPALPMSGFNVSFSTDYVPTHFTGVTINEYGNIVGATRLIRSSSASIEETQIYGGLDGDGRVNTASELLAMASVLGIQDVKKEDALKLYTEIAMENATNSFLGVTGTTHSQVLERLRGKYNFTQAEITGAIRATVAEVVNAEFNKTSGFMLDRKYNVVLTRDAKTGQYTLSYERPSVENDDKQISAPTLEALSSAMSRSGDFSATAFNVVREQAALIPAVIFDGWKRATPNMVNPYELLTQALTNFYITPNNENYRVICGIYARAQLAALTDGDEFTSNMLESIGQTLVSFNREFHTKVAGDIRTKNQMIAAANIPNEPQYGIFTLNIESGDEIFVSKRQPAAGLLVSY